MKLRHLFFLLAALSLIPLVCGISFSCSNCYVDDCTCYSDCSSGYLNIYEGNCYDGISRYDLSVSGGTAHWNPKSAGTYNGQVTCDDGSSSACQGIVVSQKETVTTYWPPLTLRRTTTTLRVTTPKKTTTPKTTTTARQTNRTTTTATVTIAILTTTNPITTITAIETPAEETTTTFYICNRNDVCESQNGENYDNCPKDCPSGFPDDYCDKESDGRCDPDCLSWEDPDCKISRCGDGICESSQGETLENCPDDCVTVACGDNYCDYDNGENYSGCREDCPSGGKDGYCDKVNDGKCDPDCLQGEDPDCSSGLIPAWLGQYFWVLLLLLLLLIAFIVIIFFLYKRGKKSGYGDKNAKIMAWIKKKLKEGEDPEIIKKGLEAEGYDPSLVEKAEEKLWES